MSSPFAEVSQEFKDNENTNRNNIVQRVKEFAGNAFFVVSALLETIIPSYSQFVVLKVEDLDELPHWVLSNRTLSD